MIMNIGAKIEKNNIFLLYQTNL